MSRSSQSTISKAKNSLSHMGKSSRSSSSRGSSRGSSSRGRSRGSSSRSRRSSGLPSWATISLGVVGVCGLVYGLMQIGPVSDFMEPVISDVGEFFGLSDDTGIDTTSITHDRTYSTMVGS